MTKPIRRAGVIGAGVMGSGIAAHFANAGIEVLLLDIVPPNLTDAEKKDPAARSRFAAGGLEKALKAQARRVLPPVERPPRAHRQHRRPPRRARPTATS